MFQAAFCEDFCKTAVVSLASVFLLLIKIADKSVILLENLQVVEEPAKIQF